MQYLVPLYILALWVKLHFLKVILIFVIVYLLYKISVPGFQRRTKLPPGPFGLPIWGNVPFLGHKPYETVAKMRKRYGDIIRLKFGRKHVVVLNEFKILKEGMSHSAALNRPEDIAGDFNFGFSFVSGRAWKEQRRFATQAIKSFGLGNGSWESLTKESVNDFVKDLKTYQGKPVDIALGIESYVCNDFMAFIYGKKLDPETEIDELRELAKCSNLISKYIPMISTSYGSYIPGFRKLCEYFDVADYRLAVECNKQYQALAKKEVEKHELSHNSCDYINMFKNKMETMKNLHVEHYFTDEYMTGNAKVLLLGGTTTLAHALLALFRLMAANLDVQEKIHRELDSLIGGDGSISYDEKVKVPYTFAAILEAQRYFTLCPFSTRVLSEDIELGGYLIPKGWRVIANLWAVHNDPENWKDPHLFQPERFLAENKTDILMNPPNFTPFSVGSRNCLIQNLAYVSIFAYFLAVMQGFKIMLPTGMQATFDSTFGLTTHINPQPLCFIERCEAQILTGLGTPTHYDMLNNIRSCKTARFANLMNQSLQY